MPVDLQRIQKNILSTRIPSEFPPNVIDSFQNAKLRISFTRDLRDIKLPDKHEVLESTQKFNRLFQHNPEIIRREIINWDFALNEPKDSPLYLPDSQTNIHLNFLYDEQGQSIFCNLVNPSAMAYLKNHSSRFYRFIQGRYFESVSLHLGFAAEELEPDKSDGHSVPKTEVLKNRDIIKRILDTLTLMQSNLKKAGFAGNALIETLDYQKDRRVDKTYVSAYTFVTEPVFVSHVLGVTNFGLLLDVAHILITSENKELGNPVDYICEILSDHAESLSEIHIAIPEKPKERWLDKHLSVYNNLFLPQSDVIFNKILDFLLSNRPPNKPLTINLETPSRTVHLDAVALVMFLREVMGF